MRDLVTALILSAPTGESADVRAMIFGEVLRGRATSRKEIGELLGLRSTTVSELVGELIRVRLLTEMLGPSLRRGRPTQILVANPHRLAVIVFQVVGRSIRAVCINLLGQVLRQEQEEVPADCENAGMRDVFVRMRERVAARMPETTEVAGVSFALSGLVDPLTEEWMFTSRWPAVQGLRLRDSLGDPAMPTFVTRNLDAELRARLALSKGLTGSTLLLHWGDGIGTAFGLGGEIAFGKERGFGEIGHWRLAGHEARCRCGRRGCLETIAALWAIGDDVMKSGSYSGLDEAQVAHEMRDRDLMTLPKMTAALDAMIVSLANLCRVLFPKQIIVTGPFVENSAVWDAFRTRLRREGIMVGHDTPDLILGERSDQMAIDGAVAPLLKRSLDRLLRTASDAAARLHSAERLASG